VAVTCACAFVDPWAAILFFGFVPGVVVVLSVIMFDKIKIDDPVGAISVHAVCGALGTTLLGFFHNKQGLLYSGETGFLFAQIVGVVSVFLFSVISAFILFAIIKATVGLRVSEEEEIEGLDIHEHGNVAYPDFVSVTSGSSAMAATRGPGTASYAVQTTEFSRGVTG
jgi:Amt family ammonium transporter